jgi:hypothetical protein
MKSERHENYLGKNGLKSMNGVLNEDYAQGRRKKPELRFRYTVRACFIKKAVNRFLKKQDGLNILDFGAADALTMLEMSGFCRTAVYWNRILRGSNAKNTLPENISPKAMLLMPRRKAGEIRCCQCARNSRTSENPEPVLSEAFSALRPGGLFVATSPILWDHLSTALIMKADQHEVEMTKTEWQRPQKRRDLS